MRMQLPGAQQLLGSHRLTLLRFPRDLATFTHDLILTPLALVSWSLADALSLGPASPLGWAEHRCHPSGLMVRLEFLPQHLAAPGSLVRVGTGGQDAWVD